jgi:hypothetical protein
MVQLLAVYASTAFEVAPQDLAGDAISPELTPVAAASPDHHQPPAVLR